VTPRYSYLIYYTIDDATDEVVVVAIQHSARRRDYADH
jgi:mRNA-degrading endonuclease RelE of RelBE toxin-antitoxin system